MLKVYRAPDGTTWQYEEGRQPAGYVDVELKARKAPPNKSRRAQDKSRGSRAKES